MNRLLQILGIALLSILVARPATAEVSELRIAKQPSIGYLPLVIMEHDKLIEKHARAMGLGNLHVKWVMFTNGGAGTAALLADQVNIVSTGSTNMLVLSDHSNGAIKGLTGEAALPLALVTRKPAIKSIKDFSDQDRIALPTVGVSPQAIILQMAAEKAFGPQQRRKLDHLAVSLGHPDAMVALLNPRTEIDAHFGASPYQEEELQRPGLHRVLTTFEVAGGPINNAVVMTSRKFHDANPKTIAAFLAAHDEAVQSIKKDKRAAAQKYLEVTHEKYPVDEIVSLISSPSFIFSSTPIGTMKFATFMYEEGLLKHKPSSWKDFYFPDIQGRAGS